MIIEYNDDITLQRFLEEGEVLTQLGVNAKKGESYSLGEIENPGAALGGLEGLPNGKLIAHLFSHPQVPNITLYDETFNQWFRLGGTWPATIDTITHLRGQRESRALQEAERILDVACGNGMAGIYAANKNPNIKKVWFSDINPNAIGTASKNTDFSRRKNIFGLVGNNGLEDMKKLGRNDVIIASAVPATPGYDGLQRPLNPIFEGTQLLEDLLRDAPESLTPGGKLILSHSSCGEEVFKEAAQRYGAKVDRVLYERDNAYRIEFLNDPSWVDALVQQGGLKRKEERGFTHWHTVRVKEISYD